MEKTLIQDNTIKIVQHPKEPNEVKHTWSFSVVLGKEHPSVRLETVVQGGETYSGIIFDVPEDVRQIVEDEMGFKIVED